MTSILVDDKLNKRMMDSPEENPTPKRAQLHEEISLDSFREILKIELNAALDTKLISIATKEDVSSLQKELEEVKVNSVNHESRLARLEQKNRSRNLIFKNIPQKTNYKEYLTSLLHGIMELPTINFGSIFTLHTIKDKNKVILLVEFYDNNSTYEVLRKTYKLKETGIIVEKDLSPEERTRKSALLKIRRELLKRHTAESGDLKVVVSERKIKVNDEIFLFDKNKNEFMGGSGVNLNVFLIENFNLEIDVNLNLLNPQ